MSRPALPADAALARTASLGWAASRGLSWPRQLSDYVLTTLGVVVAAGLLFWRQPVLLSAPFDGVFTYLNMVQTHQWQPPGAPLGGYYPLEGMGSRLMPSVPALLPHTYAVWLVGDPALRVWLAYLILTGLLALATLAYLRAAGVSRGASSAATALTVVLAATQSDLIRATWEVLYALVGMLAALAIFLQVGRGRLPWCLAWSVALVAFVVVYVLSEHVFNGFLAGPVLGLALLAHLLAAPSRTERLWKLGTLVGTGVALLALGVPQWMLLLAASISRATFFDEILAQPQYARNAGLIFRSTDSFTILYVLAIVGTIGELVTGDRRRRTLAAIVTLLSVGLAGAGLVWLTTDLRWRGPAPAYFNVLVFPWLALAAVRGIAWMLAWGRCPAEGLPRGWSWRWPAVALVAAGAFLGSKLLLGAATPTTVALLAAILGSVALARFRPTSHQVAMAAVWSLAILLVLFSGEVARIDWWRGGVQDGPEDGRNGVQQLFAVTPPFLRERVGITPGSAFRGYADSLVIWQQTPLLVPIEVLAWHGQEIPTLSQYTYFVVPEYHLLVSRLLNRPGDHPNVNHRAISRIDVRIMRMLGLRYLMVKDAEEPPELVRAERQGEYRLYELPDPNLGSFSPTRAHPASDAAGLLAILSNASFDPRVDVAVADDVSLPGDLVPATDTALTFERGGFRFAARSGGRSLVALPVQYTNCLDLLTVRGAGEPVRAVRVNLVETGVLFSGDVEVEGRYRSSGPWERCLRHDLADTERLRVGDLVQRKRVPTYSHPGPRLPIFAPYGLD